MTAKSSTLTVEQALAAVLAGVVPIAETERVGLMQAAGRVLTTPLASTVTQPPFTASAMDGYAVRTADVGPLPVSLRVIGSSAAGHAFDHAIGPGEAVRIFTGAALPPGADAIIIQENTKRDGETVTIIDGQIDPEYVRPRGGDFRQGDAILPAGRVLSPRDVTIAAAMGHAHVNVRRRPTVAILATGDELVLPGETPRADQIVCSNPFGVAALAAGAGAVPEFLGIAADTRDSLTSHISRAAGADILVTLGGASVGDHDLVGPVLRDHGLALSFWKIAMRPGKPLMFGTLEAQRVLGLPGNPVSSLITARLFLVPLILALTGRPPQSDVALSAKVMVTLSANGPRAHYMRATSRRADGGTIEVMPVRSQDSSLLSPLVDADCLIVRPIGAPAVGAGQSVPIIPLDL